MYARNSIHQDESIFCLVIFNAFSRQPFGIQQRVEMFIELCSLNDDLVYWTAV